MRKNILFFLLMILALTGCEEKFSSSSELQLAFSCDTVKFDTVFTSLSSLTMRVQVYNPNSEGLYISRVALKGGTDSQFRFNIDGQACPPGGCIENLTIYGGDSLCLLVEVTVNPQSATTPQRIEDQLLFQFNQKTQSLPLEAYGQQAKLLRNLHVTQDTTLTAELPYLVYGALVVDSGCTLNIAPGCLFYMHDASQIAVYGRLHANGTADQPILFRGDRLDNLFTDVPYDMSSGQWYGIFLVSDEKHELHHVETHSTIYGLYAQCGKKTQLQQLLLDACRLHNSTMYGLLLINTDLTAYNTEVSNCGSYCVYLAGGKHDFTHCTIANYYNHADHGIQGSNRESVPAVCVNDIPKYAQMETRFRNCIITGTQTEEWALLTYFPERYALTMAHCYLRADSTTLTNENQYQDITCYKKKDEVFANCYYQYSNHLPYDFQLDSLSPARNIADSLVAVEYPTDRNGHSRLADGKPDLGAYEWNN